MFSCASVAKVCEFSSSSGESIARQTEEAMIATMRDYYEGTPIDMTKGMADAPLTAPAQPEAAPAAEDPALKQLQAQLDAL